MAGVKPIPDGYPRVTPYLCCDGAGDAIDFYTKVLGAKEKMRMGGPDGKIGHAELELGDSVIMLADEHPQMGFLSPKSVGGTPVTISVYVEDVDEVFERALKEGASSERAHPATGGWILDERGEIRRHINVFVNGELRPREDAVGDDDCVDILPAISGG